VGQADAAQIAFEIHGLILALHYEARFLRKPGSLAQANQGFENILQRNSQAFEAIPSSAGTSAHPDFP
jgi:hypothetical protein